ncbi:MAG TPA: hypothetical protein VGR26_12980 [Acidimicrobiales bacterium]|nr:hypothetical protein [Acidimicrobiales bacterium]
MAQSVELGDPAVATERRTLESLARRLLQAPLQRLGEDVGARVHPPPAGLDGQLGQLGVGLPGRVLEHHAALPDAAR